MLIIDYYIKSLPNEYVQVSIKLDLGAFFERALDLLLNGAKFVTVFGGLGLVKYLPATQDDRRYYEWQIFFGLPYSLKNFLTEATRWRQDNGAEQCGTLAHSQYIRRCLLENVCEPLDEYQTRRAWDPDLPLLQLARLLVPVASWQITTAQLFYPDAPPQTESW